MDKENAVYICMEYCYLVTKSCPTPCDPSDCSHQACLSMGFFRQEYWSGLPLPSPGDLPNPGIKPVSPVWQANSLLLSHLGSQNGIMSLVATWIDLNIILSEVRERQISCDITYMWNLKKDTSKRIYRAEIDSQM